MMIHFHHPYKLYIYFKKGVSILELWSILDDLIFFKRIEVGQNFDP